VQPIHADDVVRGILMLLKSGRFQCETLELGGPAPIPFREFIELVQTALRGAPGRIVTIPLWAVRPLLALAEPVLRPVMPVTAGQLAVFANDSVASENWLLERLRSAMPSTRETIEALVDAARTGRIGGNGRRTNSPARPMSDSAKRLLEEECRIFSTYLLGSPPSAYVREQYVRAAHMRGVAFDDELSPFDRLTLRLARYGPVPARCADAYCAIFHRAGALRRKLIVLAAILEHVAPASDAFDNVEPRHAALAVLSLVAYGWVAAGSLVLGALVLLPASLPCWLAARSMNRGSQTRAAE
jgi:hypothetical protein